MGLLPIDRIRARIEAGRRESTAELFNSLLYMAEAFLKTYTAAIVAGIPDEANRHRYRLCHKLVRATGIGEWDDVLADVSTGPAAQHLLPGAALLQKELTERIGTGTWAYDAAALLHKALSQVLPDLEPLATRVGGRRWFTLLVQLRNKTRGHGAPTSNDIAKIVADVESSINLYLANSLLVQLAWSYLKRNLSGKYNVLALCGTSATFERLKGDRGVALEDGIYVDLGSPCRVELIETTLDLTEFYYPNDHFRQRTSEWLSYISGARKDVDGSMYLAPATALPPSSTDGGKALDSVGNCFGNLPLRPIDYVSREELEKDLISVLTDDRHSIVTLVGRGGVGKTSLALESLFRIAHSSERFIGIVWLSARDIDLLPQGPKLVKPSALTPKDMAQQFTSLFQPSGWDQKGFNPEQYLAESLRNCEIGPLLLVFDNFETVQQPIEVFHWLDTHVRCPNKILITTRHRDFKGDYPVEVGGMTEDQCNELVLKTAEAIGISGSIKSEFCRDVYRESEGHPYVVKVLVGEAADGKKVRRIERIVAGKDDLLDALFERTYKRLSPAAKRIFLTLSSWRSLVAHSALDAALLCPRQAERIDTVAAVDELRRVSFLDEHISPHDKSVFLSVPLVAGIFGKRKLSTSPEQSDIEEDIHFLHKFGAMQPPDLKWGLEPRIQRFFASLSEDLAQSKIKLSEEMPVLELIARHYPPAWLMIADLWRESTDAGAAPQTIEALTRYLETSMPGVPQRVAWERIAVIHRQQGNWSGFVNSQVQIAELPGADLAIISATVNTFNSVSHNLDTESRRNFAQRLAKAMEPKIVYGDSTDCSRLAWLLIRCDKEDRALEIVDCGLKLDPNDEHCQNLKLKIWKRRAEAARQANEMLTLIEASIRIAEVPTSDFQEISDAANVFNQFGRDFEPDQDRRHRLALRLAKVMETKIENANATDCSRLAWVLMQTGESERARRIVELGLRLEPQNDHCQKLKARIG
jgi:tetratricopeptide (TPR) repeat protein